MTSLAFGPDGRSLAGGSDDATIRIWAPADGTLTSILRGHTDLVLSLVYAPGGKALASGSQGGTRRLWDLAAGTQIGRPCVTARMPLRP
jgi:WD40 repeat protein